MHYLTTYGILLLLVLSGPYSTAQKVSIDLVQAKRTGIALLQAGQYEKAIDPLYECYREDPQNIDLTNQLAYCYQMTGNYRDARFFYLDVLKRDSTNLNAISNLARIYEQETNYPKARSYYEQLIRIDTTNSYYYKQNGAVAMRMGDLLAAGAYYNRAYLLNPKDITILDRLAQLYLDLNAPVYADTFARRALQLDSQNVRALQTFARVQHELKNYPAVISAVQNCMEQGDSTIYYQKMLANALLRTDSLDAAIERLSFIVENKKASEYTYHSLAVAYELQGQTDSAAYYYEAAVEAGISDEYPEYCRSLAEIYEQKTQYKKAIRFYQEAYRHSEEPDLLFHLARNYELFYKDKKMAIRQYQRYLASNDSQYRDYSNERLRLLKELVHQRVK